MFEKKNEWELNPVMPCFKRDRGNMIIYHPLTDIADIYQISGRYLNTINVGEVEETAQKLSKPASKKTLKTEMLKSANSVSDIINMMHVDTDSVSDVINSIKTSEIPKENEKRVRIFDTDEKGRWYQKDEFEYEQED